MTTLTNLLAGQPADGASQVSRPANAVPGTRNWSIRQRILASFSIILGLMVVMGGVAYTRLVSVEEQASAVQEDAMPGLYYSSQLMGAWIADYSLTKHHILQSGRSAMRAVEVRIQADRAALESLMSAYEKTIFHAEDRQHYAAFERLRAPYLRAQEEVLQLSGDNRKAEAQAALHSRLDPEFEKARAAMQELEDYNKLGGDESIKQIMGAVAAAKTGIAASFAAALLLAALSGYYLMQAITRPLGRLIAVVDVMRRGDFTQRLDMGRRDEFGVLADGFNRMADDLTELVGHVQRSVIQVNTSITEIAATSKEQQATSSEIAATTTEIGATSKEISATSKELVTTMGEVSNVAEHTAALADGGQAGLSRMEDTMRHVMEAAGSINAKLTVLNEKAGNINQVVTTITKVADQTNLLSLNAAIEAEKAGESGRGFAVVAVEIRRLADQTAVATYDIEQMVKDIQSAVSAGVMGMDKFSEEVRRGMQEMQQVSGQLSQIIHQVQALAPRFEAVNEGMQAQSTGAEQISQALTQLIEAAQQTVESLRQSSLAIDELNQVGGSLRSSVSRFKLQA